MAARPSAEDWYRGEKPRKTGRTVEGRTDDGRKRNGRRSCGSDRNRRGRSGGGRAIRGIREGSRRATVKGQRTRTHGGDVRTTAVPAHDRVWSNSKRSGSRVWSLADPKAIFRRGDRWRECHFRWTASFR